MQYMAVTIDRYETPIACADSPAELAKILHISPNAVSSAIIKGGRFSNGKSRGYDIIAVQIDDYEDELGNIPVPTGNKVAESLIRRNKNV